VIAGACLLLAAAACAVSCSGGTPTSGFAAPAAASNAFAGSSLWDDGRAEVSAYEASLRRYRIPRKFTAYLIVVKEDFSRKQLVKADPGHDPGDLVTVLKLNQVIHYQTGIYSYHQMASTFYDRPSMDLIKFSLTSFEWCGNSFKEYTRRDGRAALHVRTYWDNQAEATYPIPVAPDVVFYDQMPLWIRSLPQTPGTSRALRLVPGQIESKGAKPDLRPAVLRAEAEELIVTPAGTFRAVRWDLREGDGPPRDSPPGARAPEPDAPGPGAPGRGGGAVDSFWFDRKFPHVLLAWNGPDGSGYRLKWTRRLAYWELNRPGDEKYLEGLAAEPG
jgi:hypothetical protein